MCETRSQADVKTHLKANMVGELDLNWMYLSPDSMYYEYTNNVSDIIEDGELLDQIKNCKLLKSLLHEIR